MKANKQQSLIINKIYLGGIYFPPISPFRTIEGKNRGKSMQQIEYENKLRSLGCELLGKGLFSNVFSIPKTDKVIKVGRMDEWPTYIKWATENGHAGKFAPKVYSLKFYDTFYVAIMERLVCTVGEIQDQDGYYTNSLQVQIYFTMSHEDCEASDFHSFVMELRHRRMSGDLHEGNVMVRHDGQLVITDPISGHGSSRFRIKSGVCL